MLVCSFSPAENSISPHFSGFGDINRLQKQTYQFGSKLMFLVKHFWDWCLEKQLRSAHFNSTGDPRDGDRLIFGGGSNIAFDEAMSPNQGSDLKH